MPSIEQLLGVYRAVDYGAGVGLRDNAPAINGAIQAAANGGGGQVLLDSGPTYTILTPILLQDDVELVVPAGTTLRLAAGANTDLVRNATPAGNSRIRLSGGGTLDGNRAGQSAASYGIAFTNVTDAEVSGVQVTSCYTDGVRLTTCVRPRLLLTSTDNGSHGVALNGCTYGRVSGASWDNCRVAVAGTCDGLSLQGATLDTLVLGLTAYDSLGAGGRQAYGVREVAASGCDRTLIAAAALATNRTGATSLVGAASKVIDNAAAIATAGVPVTQVFGDAAALGAATTAAPLDHRHGMPTVAPLVPFDLAVTATALAELR